KEDRWFVARLRGLGWRMLWSRPWPPMARLTQMPNFLCAGKRQRFKASVMSDLVRSPHWTNWVLTSRLSLNLTAARMRFFVQRALRLQSLRRCVRLVGRKAVFVFFRSPLKVVPWASNPSLWMNFGHYRLTYLLRA